MSPEIKLICNWCKAEDFFAIPIVNGDKVNGYFIAMHKKTRKTIDMELLSLVSKQISSILCRIIVYNTISDVKQFYQKIIV